MKKILNKEQRELLYAAQKDFRNKQRIQKDIYLSTHPCIDCGESDPVVLDFDHIDPATKTRSIARMLSGHVKWENILKEIEKCEVRCANCHRRRTKIQIDQNQGYGNRGKRSTP